MTSFENVVGRNTTTEVEWGVVINGKDFSRQLELLEFEHQLNNPFQFTVRLSGVDGSVKISENAEVALKRKGTVFFRGVARQVEPKTENSLQLQAAGYPAALEGDISDKFKDTTVENATNSIVNNTTIESANPSGTGRTFQTSFNLSTTFNVSDFRANEKQLGEVNRLLGEYDLEWYSTFDSNNNPVFNVTEELINTASGGGSLDTLTTYGSEQTAEKVRHNVNSEKGSFDGVLVRGYGDGDDQITASAGNTGKDNRVLIYTDKTILSDSQAQQRADKLQELKTVKWQEIEVDLTNPNRVFGIGDKLTVDAKDAKLNDDYRVVKTSYKIRPSRSEFEATLTLSNKPATFVDEFNREKNKSKSQTDFAQGNRNTINESNKDLADSNNSTTVDFFIPERFTKDDAGNDTTAQVKLDYSVQNYKKNFDASDSELVDSQTKVVSTEVTDFGDVAKTNTLPKLRDASNNGTSADVTKTDTTKNGGAAEDSSTDALDQSIFIPSNSVDSITAVTNDVISQEKALFYISLRVEPEREPIKGLDRQALAPQIGINVKDRVDGTEEVITRFPIYSTCLSPDGSTNWIPVNYEVTLKLPAVESFTIEKVIVSTGGSGLSGLAHVERHGEQGHNHQLAESSKAAENVEAYLAKVDDDGDEQNIDASKNSVQTTSEVIDEDTTKTVSELQDNEILLSTETTQASNMDIIVNGSALQTESFSGSPPYSASDINIPLNQLNIPGENTVELKPDSTALVKGNVIVDHKLAGERN